MDDPGETCMQSARLPLAGPFGIRHGWHSQKLWVASFALPTRQGRFHLIRSLICLSLSYPARSIYVKV